MTFGFQRSTVPDKAIVAVAPRAAAVRSIVPTFPGSWTASSTRMRHTEGISSVSRERDGTSPIAMTPCGDSVSAALRKSFSETSSISTRECSSCFRRASPRGAEPSWGATSTPRIGSPERSSSSTERTPSATKSECFSRAFRLCRSRASVSSLTGWERGECWNRICLCVSKESSSPEYQ